MSSDAMRNVVVHARGVTQTSSATQLVKLIAEAALREGKDAVAFGYYNDSPDRINVPIRFYAGVSSKPIVVSPSYDPPVIEASVVLDPTMLKAWTVGEGVGGVDVLQGLRKDGILVINTEFKLDELRCFLARSNFEGKVVTVAAGKIDRAIHMPMAAVVAQASSVVSVQSLREVVEQSMGEEKVMVVDRACKEAVVEEM